MAKLGAAGFTLFEVGEAVENKKFLAIEFEQELDAPGVAVIAVADDAGDPGRAVNVDLSGVPAGNTTVIFDAATGEISSSGKQIDKAGWARIEDAAVAFKPTSAPAGVRADTHQDKALRTADANIEIALPDMLGAQAQAAQVVFIDASVVNRDALLQGIDDSFDVFIIDGASNGARQMASVLASYDNLDAVHIIAHGSPGTMSLGNSLVTAGSIEGPDAGAWASVGGALGPDGDILIYGCDFGADVAGAGAVAALADATGADVAASADDTGHASLGGDWELETAVGEIGTDVVVSQAAQEGWFGLLAIVTLDWAAEFASNTNILGTTANATVGGVTVTIGTTQAGTYDAGPAADINVTGSLNGRTGFVEWTMNADSDDNTEFLTTTITFSQTVYDLTFTLIDIDGNTSGQTWTDRVTVTSDNGVASSAAVGSLVTYTPATGVAIGDGGNTNDARSEVTYTFAQGVDSITIVYSADDAVNITNPGNQRLGLDDLTFDTAPSDWVISGPSTVNEGSDATYTIDFNGNLQPGDSASVDVSLVDIDTTSADYANFVAAVTAAANADPNYSFDGTTLTYTEPSAPYSSNFVAGGAAGATSIVGQPGTVALNLGDDQTVNRNIGFSFDFYGTSYTTVNVDSNGYVTFGGAPGSTWNNGDIAAGTALGGNPAIAAFWDDLSPNQAGDVYVRTVGSPGSQQFIVEWNGVPYYNGGSTNGGTIQLILDEATGAVTINYMDVDFQGTSHDNGVSATIGIQNGSGTGDEFSQNTNIANLPNASLTYTPAGSDTQLVFDLGTVGDNIAEGDEDFRIDLTNAVNSNILTPSVTTTIIDDDNPPVATDDAFTTSEDSIVAGNIVTADNGSGVDSDADGDTLSVIEINGGGFTPGVPVALPSGAEVTLQPNGVYVYNPNGQFESLAVGETDTDTFTYTIDDGHGNTDTATVTITITGANDGPSATDNTAAVTEDTSLTDTGNLITDDDGNGVDSDPDTSDTLNVTGVDGVPVSTGSVAGTYGTLTFDAGGNYTYSLNNAHPAVQALAAGETLSETFSYDITDGNGGADSADLVITINGNNDAPTGFDAGGAYHMQAICGAYGGLVQVQVGSVIATFDNFQDVDTTDTPTYSIVDSGGNPVVDPDFEIVGNELRVKAGNSLTEGVEVSRQVIVRAEDGNGGNFDQTLSFDVGLYSGPYSGGPGRDLAVGTSGADVMSGGGSVDYLFGQDGNDTLVGGGGYDVLEGGAGADVLNGGSEGDTASYSYATGAVTADLANAIVNTGDAAGDTYISIEHLRGSAFADTLSGDAGGNWIVAGAGDDVINGRGGNDYMFGEAGNDTFVFASGDGDDWIVGFQTGAGSDDVIDVRSFGFGDFTDIQNNASVGPSGCVVIQLDGSTSITLHGVTQVSDLHQDDFLI